MHLHFNFQIEQRKKCGLQLKLVEVFVSIKRACFALFLFSTQICKLILVGEVFEEVSLGVHCCCSVFLMCIVKKESVLL